MNKKIAIALAALMLSLALPASAAIQATSVEIRGRVVVDAATEPTPSWDASTFAGFWYDFKADLKTETLTITEPIWGRNIQENTLWYNTTKVYRTLKVVENGHTSTELLNAFPPDGRYYIVGWQGQPYVAVKGKAKKLSRHIIEHLNRTSDAKDLTFGENWEVGDGWNLTAQSINATHIKLILSKNSTTLNNKTIAQGGIYVYSESIANETNVPLFVTYVESISGAMVQLRYTWAISKNITEIHAGDVFGKLEVITASDDTIKLNNKDRTLSLDSTVDIMGDLKFKVADSDTLRFYPMVLITTPGRYKVRGSVAEGTGTQAWDASTFAGFWYDLKDNKKTETIEITSPIVGRDIQENTLWYNTSRETKTLKAYKNQPGSFDSGDLAKFTAGTGKYSILGWQGQMYVAVKDNAKKLSKLIIEQGNATSEKKSLTVGETWDIGDGWTLTAQSIDAKASPRQVWLVLSKNGTKLDDKVIAQGRTYVYIEKNFAGESDVPLFVTYIDSVFAGATSDMVQLRYTWAISTSVTEVKCADVFGNMEVITAGNNQLVLKNKDKTITLTRDGTIDVMGELKFRVADSDTLRYYPMVEYEISGVVLRGDVNRNGVRDTGDATLLLSYIAELPIPAEYLPILPIGDMNCNGMIDTGDATMVLRDIVSLTIDRCWE